MDVKRHSISRGLYSGEIKFQGALPEILLMHNGLEAGICDVKSLATGRASLSVALPEIEIEEARHVFALIARDGDQVLDIFSVGLDFEDSPLAEMHALRQEVDLLKTSLRRLARAQSNR